MLSIKDCVDIVYKSTALSYGSTRNKWQIVKNIKTDYFSKQMKSVTGSEEYTKWEKLKDNWNDLSTRLSWGFHFYGVDMVGEVEE